MGQATSVSFNASDYIPADLQNDYATAASYYNQVQTAAQGTKFVNGTLQLSPAAANAIATTIETTVEASIPVLGQAFAIFMALAPQAGAGPGVCATSPPASPAAMASWPGFTSWASFNGTYALGAPGSFEAYANPILQHNWELGQNCFSDKAAPAPSLLAALVASWNATHQGPSRTITRSGLNPAGFGTVPNFDPIADALQQAAIAKYIPASAQTFDAVIAAQEKAPNNLSSSFAVNTGAHVVHVVPLTLHLRTASAARPTLASSGPSLGTVAVLGVGGVAVWAIATKGGTAGALAWAKRLFRF
jgi:hypothetical protein